MVAALLSNGEQIPVVSLDLSLRATGVYWETGEASGSETILAPPHIYEHDGALAILMQRLERIYKTVEKASGPGVLTLVEDYAFGIHGRGATSGAETGGIARAIAWQKGEIVTVPISTWKVLALGPFARQKKRTAAEKAAYLEMARRLHNRGFANDNEADAYMIYHAAILSLTSKREGGTQKLRTRMVEALKLLGEEL